MRQVSKHLSDLFLARFKVTVPTVYKSDISLMQDSVVKRNLITFLEQGFSPDVSQVHVQERVVGDF